MSNNLDSQTSSPVDLVNLGEQIYFADRDRLEKEKLNQFAVIEVETKDIITNEDKLTAIQEAQKKHPGKLFYIVQIGRLRQQGNSEMNEIKKYGWTF